MYLKVDFLLLNLIISWIWDEIIKSSTPLRISDFRQFGK